MRTYVKDAVNKVGETVTLQGWVDVRRDHGKLIFIDLRDKTGVVQLVFIPKNEAAYEQATKLRPEWVVSVTGTVKARPENMVNEDMVAGSIELPAEEVVVLNEANTPPFPIDGDGKDIDEDLRLKYRYLDLRRPRLQENLRTRSTFLAELTKTLTEEEFVQVETPMLTKSTPEGSRDFVVPSRYQPGKFYALPQSPQQYKQLLMASGIEKYFQIARAMRDEDLRADRGYEHTQLDLEMSFVTQEDVMKTVEDVITRVVKAMGKKLKSEPFPRLTYEEAMKEHGADKFDLRTDEEKEEDVLAFAWVHSFPFFEKNKEGNWTFTHNPFSMPNEEDIEKLLKGEDIENIKTQQYDLVCNGFEVGGGSVRAHKSEILKAVFTVMGYSEEKIKEQFGHMLEAFDFGTPPHGGIALGIDRLVMILQNEESLREVVAFPQTATGRTSVMDAPSELSPEQLKELGLTVEKKEETK